MEHSAVSTRGPERSKKDLSHVLKLALLKLRYNTITTMKFTYQDQLNYTKAALQLLDSERLNEKSLETILDFGELIKKYAADDNAVIYDATEYIYEQLRLLKHESGAYDDTELRRKLEDLVSGG